MPHFGRIWSPLYDAMRCDAIQAEMRSEPSSPLGLSLIKKLALLGSRCAGESFAANLYALPWQNMAAGCKLVAHNPKFGSK